jgi:hypothetical protein
MRKDKADRILVCCDKDKETHSMALFKKAATIQELKNLSLTIKNYLNNMQIDLEKAERGNRSAAQRLRTQSINFSKIAKDYRRISLLSEKKISKVGNKKI